MMAPLLFVATLLTAPTADSRFVPFLGCWSLVTDELREPVGVAEPEEQSEEKPIGLVCLSPGDEGVQMKTFSGDEAFLDETLMADGQKHPVSEGKCRGWQQLDWSLDGRRLFTRSELTCEENRTRLVTGISTLTDSSTWVELQSVGSGNTRAVLIRRYRRASDDVTREHSPSFTDEELRESTEARFRNSSARMGIDEVIEASSRVEPEVIEALLLERGGRFPLDSDALVRLSDAEVPPSVIDLMVALTFPEEFEVQREASSGGGGFVYSPGYDPFFSSAYAYPYYFAPFGYYYWYAPWNPIYVVPPIDSPGASVGRVVEGRGYTRVTRVAPFDDGGERRARHRGESGEGGSSWSKGSESSSSGGSVSREGYSHGGSGGQSARPKKN